MDFNNSYLNLTPNKTPRNTRSFVPEFVVMHETAGYGSLQWNLRADVRSSYNYLIGRDGTVYHYVDERAYFAWHAGVSSAARGYVGGQINIYAIGVELEGPNDGTPITTAQTKSMIELIRYFRTTYGIPISRDYYFAHKDVAPGYKWDPRGYSVEHTIKMISDEERSQTVLPNTLGAQLRNQVYKRAGGGYHPEWAFHQFAQQHHLGSPIKVGMDFSTNGVRYTGEVYGHDVIISPYNQWSIVIRADELTDVAIYNDLMRFTYGVLGVVYRPEQAFYHFLRQHRQIGLPLNDSIRLVSPTGRAYAVQPYTFDALYTPIAPAGQFTDWSVVQQLSSLLARQNMAAEDTVLRDLIYASMYDRVQDRYDARRTFIQRAFELGLGAPLSKQIEWTFDGITYQYVIYAGDTLYAPKDNVTDIRRLSQTSDGG